MHHQQFFEGSKLKEMFVEKRSNFSGLYNSIRRGYYWVLIICTLGILPLGYYTFYISSALSRISILLFYLVVTCTVYISLIKKRKYTVFPLLILSLFIYIYSRLPGIKEYIFTEVTTLPLIYGKKGNLMLSKPYISGHNFFFLTYLHFYLINMTTTFPLKFVPFINVFLGGLLLSLLFLNICKNMKLSKLTELILYFLFFSLPIMNGIDTGYDYMSRVLFLYIIYYTYYFFTSKKNHNKNKPKLVNNLRIPLLLLVFGCVMGSPRLAVILAIMFFIFFIFSRREETLIYMLVAFFYLIYPGILYLIWHRGYLLDLINGFLMLIRGENKNIMRVLPTYRVSGIPWYDVIIASFSFLSLIAIVSVSCSVVFYDLLLESFFKRGIKIKEKNTSVKITDLSLVIIVAIVTIIFFLSYTIFSILPEYTRSDVRSISRYYVELFSPFVILMESIKKRINAKGIFTYILVILAFSSALRIFFIKYPKSKFDSILVFENSEYINHMYYKAGNKYIFNFADSKYITTIVSNHIVEGMIINSISPLFEIRNKSIIGYLSYDNYYKYCICHKSLRDRTILIVINPKYELTYPSLYYNLDYVKTVYSSCVLTNAVYTNSNVTIYYIPLH